MKKILIGAIAFVLMCFNVKAVEINPDDIENMTYIIGEYMFSNNPSPVAPYQYALTADFIMYAAKTIDSDEFSDMIIYYKNSGGGWNNAITNAEIVHTEERDDLPKSFNVYYKDGLFFAPEIRLCHLNICKKSENPDDYLVSYDSYNNGVFTYYLDTLIRNGATTNNQNAIIELYEKNSDDYTILNRDASGYFKVDVEIGKVKTVAARYYILDAENKPVYSDYSEELVLGSTKLYSNHYEKPVLKKDRTSFDSEQGNFVVTLSNNVNVSNVYNIEYGELYEKNGENLTKVLDNFSMNGENDVYVVPGQKKTYVLRGYMVNSDNQRVYMEDSDEFEVDLSAVIGLPKPQIALDSRSIVDDNTYQYNISVANQDSYDSNCEYLLQVETYPEDGMATIDNEYYGYDEMPSFRLRKGAFAKVTVRVSYLLNGEEIYGEFSNEIVVFDKPELIIEGSEETYYERNAHINYNYYYFSPFGYAVDKYIIYEKTGSSYNAIYESEHANDVYELNILPNTNKTYVAKAFVTIGENTYESDFSDEVIISTIITSPALSVSNNPTYSNGKYSYTVNVNSNEYEYIENSNKYTVDHYNIYREVDGANDTLAVYADIANTATLDIDGGDINSYYAEVCVEGYDGEEYCSGRSDSVEVVTVAVPTLSTNGSIRYENNYYRAVVDVDTNNANITGYLVYEQVPSSSYAQKGEVRQPNTSFETETMVGYMYNYKVRAILERGGVIYTSADSNVLNVGYTNLPEPPSIGVVDSQLDGTTYNLQLKVNNIDEYAAVISGVEFFEKVGTTSPIYTSLGKFTDLSVDNDTASLSLPVGEDKTIVAWFYTAGSSTQIESSYSNELSIDLTP